MVCRPVIEKMVQKFNNNYTFGGAKKEIIVAAGLRCVWCRCASGMMIRSAPGLQAGFTASVAGRRTADVEVSGADPVTGT